MPEKASYIGTLSGSRPSSRVDFGEIAILRQLGTDATSGTLLRSKCPEQKCASLWQVRLSIKCKCRRALFVSAYDILPPKRGPAAQFQSVGLSGCNFHSAARNHKHHVIAIHC